MDRFATLDAPLLGLIFDTFGQSTASVLELTCQGLKDTVRANRSKLIIPTSKATYDLQTRKMTHTYPNVKQVWSADGLRMLLERYPMTQFMDAATVEGDGFDELLMGARSFPTALKKMRVPEKSTSIPLRAMVEEVCGIEMDPPLTNDMSVLVQLGKAFGNGGKALRAAGCTLKLTQHVGSGASEIECNVSTPGGTVLHVSWRESNGLASDSLEETFMEEHGDLYGDDDDFPYESAFYQAWERKFVEEVQARNDHNFGLFPIDLMCEALRDWDGYGGDSWPTHVKIKTRGDDLVMRDEKVLYFASDRDGEGSDDDYEGEGSDDGYGDPVSVEPAFIMETFEREATWTVLTSSSYFDGGQLRCLRHCINEYIFTTPFFDTPPPQHTDRTDVAAKVEALLPKTHLLPESNWCGPIKVLACGGSGTLRRLTRCKNSRPYSNEFVEWVVLCFLAQAVELYHIDHPV